jgi:hypothetical protein
MTEKPAEWLTVPVADIMKLAAQAGRVADTLAEFRQWSYDARFDLTRAAAAVAATNPELARELLALVEACPVHDESEP